ncbi:MAG TPA: Gfo/Idh/MocA family oxidoreductase [Verrucomicrobiota bacterium]|nr:Gfo/Idh/MocA family oxidoreductase [Verrucomicrobiota bacterium]
MDLPADCTLMGAGFFTWLASISRSRRGVAEARKSLHRFFCEVSGLAMAALALGAGIALAADLRIGMIGLDTSHVVAFTQLLNDPARSNHVAGGRVVAAYPGGSQDIESSRTRVDGYTRELRDKWGVRIVDTIEALCEAVDVVMLESVDGRPHLEQVKPVIRARKPVFIDKPMAGSLRDVIAIQRLAREHGVPCFSSSSLRYYPGLIELKKAPAGEVRGAVSTGPCPVEPHHPDLFWYGIHAVEALYAVLGPGCEQVTRATTPNAEVVTGVWKDGRFGTMIGLREGAAPYRVTVYGSKAVVDQKPGGDYGPLVREVMQFFQTGVAPVSPEETLELFAFMEGADESKRQGGKPVRIADVIRNAGGEPAK